MLSARMMAAWQAALSDAAPQLPLLPLWPAT
jgi:hypothetical protein